ncbi:MAG: DsbA family protein [Pseudomonadota bacterium]
MRPALSKPWCGLALGAALLVSMPQPLLAQSPDRDSIEAIVRDYLLREPEVVIEAIEAYRAAQETARNEALQTALAEHRDALTAADHPSQGPSNPAVTVVEFFDYRCGFCRRMVPAIASLMETNDDVRRVFIEFPVLGPDSLRAAQAALAVWDQAPEAYPAFHDAAMTADDLSPPALLRMAEELGLDTERMLRDMQSEAVRERLQANYQLATAIGVEGTPAYVIGDRFLPGAVPLQQLQAAVDAAREG